MVAATIAAGLGGERIADLARRLDWRDLVQLAPRTMGVFRGERLARYIERITGRARLEELSLPCAAVCTDIETGEEVRLTRGPLGTAVQASAAIPGLFQPVNWEDRLLVDGGIVANLPVAAARDLRPAMIVAVDVLTCSAGRQRRLRTGVHVALRAYHAMVHRLSETEARLADVVVQPDVTSCSVLNFRDASRLIAAGEEAMRALIPHVRAVLADRLAGAADPRR